MIVILLKTIITIVLIRIIIIQIILIKIITVILLILNMGNLHPNKESSVCSQKTCTRRLNPELCKSALCLFSASRLDSIRGE